VTFPNGASFRSPATLLSYRQRRSSPFSLDMPHAAAGSFALRLRASHRASPCATAGSASALPAPSLAIRRGSAASRSLSPVRLRRGYGRPKAETRSPSISVRPTAPQSAGRAKAFLVTSPLPSATSPTRISPRRPSRCRRSRATPGSPCYLTCRPNAWQGRDDKTTQAWSGGDIKHRAHIPPHDLSSAPCLQSI
jgi:hypothetical protein